MCSEYDGGHQSRGGAWRSRTGDHRAAGGVCLHGSVRHDVSPQMQNTYFTCVLSSCLFWFCFRISVNSNNVQSLLNAANQYQIEPVKKMCVDFLKEQVDPTNCLGETPAAASALYGYFHFSFLSCVSNHYKAILYYIRYNHHAIWHASHNQRYLTHA